MFLAYVLRFRKSPNYMLYSNITNIQLTCGGPHKILLHHLHAATIFMFITDEYFVGNCLIDK